jgi:regulator of RNase E activity RraA
VAHIGELFVFSLKAVGVDGAVLDGGVCDVSFILEEDFPVLACYRTTVDAVPRSEILDWGERALVGGDVVLGEVDGVVVVPDKVRLPVLE